MAFEKAQGDREKRFGEVLCEKWGSEQLRIVLGGRRVVTASGALEWHEDGHPSRSFIEKLWREHQGAFQGAAGTSFAEVKSADALIVTRAYVTLPAELRDVMVARYVARARWKVAADVLKLSKDRYFRAVGTVLDRVEAIASVSDQTFANKYPETFAKIQDRIA